MSKLAAILKEEQSKASEKAGDDHVNFKDFL